MILASNVLEMTTELFQRISTSFDDGTLDFVNEAITDALIDGDVMTDEAAAPVAEAFCKLITAASRELALIKAAQSYY